MMLESEDKAKAEAGQSGGDTVKHWLAEMESALKREKGFRNDGKRILDLYEAENPEAYPFNILYSNTETLAPALYNNTPRPVVRRRFKDEDSLGKEASKVVQRTLEFLQDTGLPDYATFDELMSSAVLEALTPGRGVSWFKYDAVLETVPTEEDTASYEQVTHEIVCGEEVPWNRFLHGYAKKWKDVPWVAREHAMNKAELVKNFGEEVAALVELSEEQGEDDTGAAKDKEAKGEKLACVYEVWDKASGKVLFVSPGLKTGPLKVVDDPLKLSGFFPCPKPLTFFNRVTSLVPVSLYKMYEEQAKELNRVTVRINKLIAALKVRGFYDASVEGIEKVMAAEDNTLVPAENVAALQQGQTLEKALFLMPIDKLINVLQQLYAQRQQVKQVIYEITGISDILRGASVASETATAQNIKNQWGTLRLKKMQKEVARYARDSLRLMAEIAVTRLSPETLAKMTNLPYPSAEEKAQTQQIMALAQQVGQQPPPELAAALQQPSWEELLELLQDDTMRAFRVDIETNSTVDAEATEDKESVNELLNALAQFFNGIAPLVQDGALPFDVAKELLLAVVKRFRFGVEVEDSIAKMAPPAPKPDPDKEAKAGEMEVQKLQAQTTMQAEQLKQQTAQMEFAYAKAEHDWKMQELQLKSSMAVQQHAAKMLQLRQPPAKPAGVTTA
jgi:hypothetical protein